MRPRLVVFISRYQSELHTTTLNHDERAPVRAANSNLLASNYQCRKLFGRKLNYQVPDSTDKEFPLNQAEAYQIRFYEKRRFDLTTHGSVYLPNIEHIMDGD